MGKRRKKEERNRKEVKKEAGYVMGRKIGEGVR